MSLDDSLENRLQEIDNQWASQTQDSYFHWDAKLRDVYPEDNYWWLYTELDLEREAV